MKTNFPLRVSPVRKALLCTSLIGLQFFPYGIAMAKQSNTVFEDVIVVTGVRQDSTSKQIHPENEALIAPDAASLVARIAGAGLINNGSLSGQVQYRGAFGSRVSTKINNQSFHSGGPNLMDPPMHYAPPTLIDSITVHRGASAVEFGPSLIGGVNTNLKDLDFTTGSTLKPQYDLTAIGRSADDSYAVGGIVGITNDRFKISALFSQEEGSDQGFANGDIDNTFHERAVLGLTAGYQTDLSELSVSVRRHETDPTGNPPFAMDIQLVESDFFTTNYRRELGEATLKLALGYSDIYHEMSNNRYRPAPPSTMRYRETHAAAETHSAGLALEFPLNSANLDVGVDFNDADMNVVITNPLNSAFFVNNLPDINIKRVGIYADLASDVLSWHYSLGARIDSHESSAGNASTGPAVPLGAQLLAVAFNQSDRDWDDETYDVVARMWKKYDAFTYRVSLASKNRAPGYLERYAWLPTAASAGLADGNNYVGDLGVKPETANSLEVGFDYESDRGWIKPTVYYQQIDDYIQGTPVSSHPREIISLIEIVSTGNGDSTPLRFTNVDAKIYGIDADYGYYLTSHWRLEGVVSVVRGERRDINDDLYRITPDKFSMSLVFEQSNWSASAETIFIADQDRVSDTNSEIGTDGYELFNLFATWRFNPKMTLSAGIENVFDKEYENHLGGYNRIRNSDVGLGARLPGVGRNVHVRFHYNNR